MNRRVILLLVVGLIATPAATQVSLPPVGQTLGSATDIVGGALGDLTDLDVRRPLRSATQLAQDRVARLADFVRRNREAVELDENRQPARKGVVLLLDADAGSLARAQALGFTASGNERFANLGLSAAELSVPEGMSLRGALDRLRTELPDKTLTADQIHFRSGTANASTDNVSGGKATKGTSSRRPAIATRVGLIDGGVGPAAETERARGFAKGGVVPGDHGTAIASLLRYAGVTRIVAADVYGNDPAGGNALAIVRALDWMVGQDVPVISISLVGPRNPLLERAVVATRRQGAVLVAAVGNDGPSAPPAFPASYRQVVAVTGVDGRNRALVEAGRALHLDYAAPGADLRALDWKGKGHEVRGTSFAVPLVAARIAAALDRGVSRDALRQTIDAEAQDLGKKGYDDIFGRGLLCGDCRPR